MWTTLVVFTNKHKLKRELGKPVSWQPRDSDFALKIELTWRHNNPTDPLISLLFFLPVLSKPPALRVFAPHESMQRGIFVPKEIQGKMLPPLHCCRQHWRQLSPLFTRGFCYWGKLQLRNAGNINGRGHLTWYHFYESHYSQASLLLCLYIYIVIYLVVLYCISKCP